MTKHEPGTADELLDAVGPAFGKLRRSSLLEVENPIAQKDLGRTLVLNIVLEAEQDEAREVTVGAVAEHLGVDPSVASRMVTDSITAGYLIRAASQQDGRRTVLHLSPAGRDLMTRFRRHQRSAFEQVTEGWTERERLEFARLMLKYVAAQEGLRHRAAGGREAGR
ncbi:MarR family winged helix-turn-helix transcriptional regulator [Streptomyces sp. CB01881]|uniref:MarR family winged helix-turn-helix transcriptional regulator n=1 Tax=Streptomyces sp. CB01881 TaxID=2078691 RepID=UPI000CDC1EC5|nr:MarR family winged helix-turn-helix transcriptional regulator [Streptomyces sp. CB01881]AUY52793.1 MarR family transcriptional regulator [Streptomyces sp. CB01881]TYC70511.1 MarR family transcriptional regulator [Streptomyces sp. CB01881]